MCMDKSNSLFFFNADIFCVYAGNDDGYFSMDPSTALLYQVKEIDFEKAQRKKFEIQLSAVQKDNPVKSATAMVSKAIDYL